MDEDEQLVDGRVGGDERPVDGWVGGDERLVMHKRVGAGGNWGEQFFSAPPSMWKRMECSDLTRGNVEELDAVW